jgi:hypothetical protein
MDKYGFKNIYMIVMTIQLMISSTIWLVIDNSYLYIAWVAASFLCLGSNFSMFPAAACKIFGI